MKKINILIFTFFICIVSYEGYSEDKIKEKYGFFIKGKQVLFYKKSNSPVSVWYFIKSKKERDKNEGNIIKSNMISIDENYIELNDSPKNKPNLVLHETYKEFKMKIENNTNYISEDGKIWEKLEFKNFLDYHENDTDDPERNGKIFVTFKCKWFSGEYEVVFEGY